MKTVNNLTNATIKGHSCFISAPEYNFEDDGNYFKGYVYTSPAGNGSIVITTLRSDGYTYLTVREDYMDNAFTWDEWKKQPEARLTDEFNAVTEIDIDKLIANCEAILKAINRLNDEVKDEVIDVEPIKKRLLVEQQFINDFINNEVKTIDWFKFDDYGLRKLKQYSNSLMKYSNLAKVMYDNIDHYSRKDKKQNLIRLLECGYIYCDKDNDFYVRECREIINKAKAVA